MKQETGEPGINDGSLIADAACPVINSLITEALRGARRTFHWTSLQINYNTVAQWHQDKGNIGTSAIFITGDYTGGGFQIHGIGTVDHQERLTFFCGQCWHRSLAFLGHRVSVVAFTHALAPECDVATRQTLVSLGFVLPQSFPGPA